MQVPSQHWYIAVLVVASRVADQLVASPAVDLQYRLVRAASHEEAYQHALALGLQETHAYANAAGHTVKWECLGLHDLRAVDEAELAHGTEVYNRILHTDPSSYVVAKEQLSCFWAEANKQKTAAEILGD